MQTNLTNVFRFLVCLFLVSASSLARASVTKLSTPLNSGECIPFKKELNMQAVESW